MKWSLPAVLLSIASPGISGFMVSNAHAHAHKSNTVSGRSSSSSNNVVHANNGPIMSRNDISLTRRSMATVDTETDHDTVTVDLADGRDYPIYIGSNFDDKQGKND